jgi:hypothetical protein
VQGQHFKAGHGLAEGAGTRDHGNGTASQAQGRVSICRRLAYTLTLTLGFRHQQIAVAVITPGIDAWCRGFGRLGQIRFNQPFPVVSLNAKQAEGFTTGDGRQASGLDGVADGHRTAFWL